MNCVQQEKNGVVYFTFPSFTEEGLVHGFSTRIGGVTPGEIGSMNLGFHRGDDSMNVIKTTVSWRMPLAMRKAVW